MRFLLVKEPAPKVVLSGPMVSATVPLTGVNWDREVALVIDLGEKRTAGYAVVVKDVQLTLGDEVHLQVEVRQPGPGDMVAQVLTRPYAVVRLPRIGLRQGEITVIARDVQGRELARQVVSL